MLKIKNIKLFAAVIGGLFVCFGAPEKASAQFVPAGSYQKTCNAIKTDGANLTAACSAKAAFTMVGAVLKDYFECEGDISNNNGNLQCNRNPNSPLMQQAKADISPALKVVLGVEDVNYETHQKFLRLMFDEGLAPKFYAGKLGGFVSGASMAFVTDWLAKPENASVRAGVINRAFSDVYNYGPSPKDVAFYNASKVGYLSILSGESKKLNADKVIRRMMIFAAYKKAMGRNATEAEVGYWMPKTEYFKQIVDASRAYLYAPNGAKDLTETVKRALNEKSGKQPTIDEMNKAIVKYSQTKSIYDEMK